MQENEKPTKKSMSERTRAIIGGAIGAVAGVGIGLLIHNKMKEKPLHLVQVQPENLQKMLDNPEAVVLFKEAHILVGNTASTEEF